MSTALAETGQQLLINYVQALHADPLKTKMMTSGVLSALAEVLAGHLSGINRTKELPPKQVSNVNAIQQQPLRMLKALLGTLGINGRAISMFLYGYLISAPLGHVLTGRLQAAFKGRTTPRDRILQIITANLTTAVITNSVYLCSMAVINGARSLDRVIAAWRANIGFLMRVTWFTSPISISVAQRYIPQEMWEPFFALIRFVLSTVFNTQTKKKQMAMARKQLGKGAAGGKERR